MAALDDDRTRAILQGFAHTDRKLREDWREPSFILIRLGQGRAGLKPSFDRETELGITEADLRDLQDAGYLRELPAREIGRRSDVVEIFPNDAAAIRLAGALLSEQNNEWLVQRRYLSAESMTLILDGTSRQDESIEHHHDPGEAAALNAA